VRLDGASVTGELFATLGVTPLLGRAITSDDDRETSPLTVVISERLWRTRFAADATVVGRAVTLDETAHVIVGVMPARFEFPTRRVDFWIPQVLRSDQYVYGNPFLDTLARLKPGVSREQADAEVRTISQAVARANPQVNPRQFGVALALRDEVAPQARLLLWILVAAAASLLLIACTNLANLLLTRGLRAPAGIRGACGPGCRPSSAGASVVYRTRAACRVRWWRRHPHRGGGHSRARSPGADVAACGGSARGGRSGVDVRHRDHHLHCDCLRRRSSVANLTTVGCPGSARRWACRHVTPNNAPSLESRGRAGEPVRAIAHRLRPLAESDAEGAEHRPGIPHRWHRHAPDDVASEEIREREPATPVLPTRDRRRAGAAGCHIRPPTSAGCRWCSAVGFGSSTWRGTSNCRERNGSPASAS
jgi:hypothetical protein